MAPGKLRMAFRSLVTTMASLNLERKADAHDRCDANFSQTLNHSSSNVYFSAQLIDRP
jgi:hypothetical protein